jgi:hypothetical protein
MWPQVPSNVGSTCIPISVKSGQTLLAVVVKVTDSEYEWIRLAWVHVDHLYHTTPCTAHTLLGSTPVTSQETKDTFCTTKVTIQMTTPRSGERGAYLVVPVQWHTRSVDSCPDSIILSVTTGNNIWGQQSMHLSAERQNVYHIEEPEKVNLISS